MVKKRLDKKLLFVALVITTIIFSSGVFVGWSLNQKKTEIMEEDLIKINREVENFQLETLFLKSFGEDITCPLLALRLDNLNKESYELGEKLETLRTVAKMEDDPSYIKIKEQYTRLLMIYWLMAREMKNSCLTEEFITAVYLFSDNCDKCDSQSFLLTHLKEKLNGNFLVFAIDANFTEPTISLIKNYYNVTEYPSIIIENTKYSGFKNLNELKEIICGYQPRLPIC